MTKSLTLSFPLVAIIFSWARRQRARRSACSCPVWVSWLPCCCASVLLPCSLLPQAQNVRRAVSATPSHSTRPLWPATGAMAVLRRFFFAAIKKRRAPPPGALATIGGYELRADRSFASEGRIQHDRVGLAVTAGALVRARMAAGAKQKGVPG